MMNTSNELDFISSLEKQLTESLKPVRPNPMFIHSLKEKLSQGSNINIEKPVSHMGLIILGAGLFAGALLVWIINRSKK
ncbi:MAG: hypothetical protein AB9897_07280 [Anaerolineaceae bacterium]